MELTEHLIASILVTFFSVQKMCVNLESNSVKMKALSLRLIIILSQQMDFHRKMMCSCVVSVHPSEDVRFMNLRKQWLFKGVLFSLDAIV